MLFDVVEILIFINTNLTRYDDQSMNMISWNKIIKHKKLDDIDICLTQL